MQKTGWRVPLYPKHNPSSLLHILSLSIFVCLINARLLSFSYIIPSPTYTLSVKIYIYMQIPTRVYSITFVFLYVYIVHHFSAVRKIFSPSSLNAKCKLCFYKRQNIKISVKLTIHIVNNYLFVA